jgi:hypothetical protein
MNKILKKIKNIKFNFATAAITLISIILALTIFSVIFYNINTNRLNGLTESEKNAILFKDLNNNLTRVKEDTYVINQNMIYVNPDKTVVYAVYNYEPTEEDIKRIAERFNVPESNVKVIGNESIDGQKLKAQDNFDYSPDQIPQEENLGI